MTALLKPQLKPVEEVLFELWDEYKELTGGNCIIQPAIDATRHRYNAKRKHITYHEAKGIAAFSLYGVTADGKTSPYDCMTRMVNTALIAKNKARTPEAKTHLERKWILMRDIVNCLEKIYQD